MPTARRKKPSTTGPVQLLLFTEPVVAAEESELDRLVAQIILNIASSPMPEEAL
jgi:hypothetical protein